MGHQGDDGDCTLSPLTKQPVLVPSQPAFLCNPGPPTQGYQAHSVLGPPTSMASQENAHSRLAGRIIWWRDYLHGGSLFLGDTSPCPADKRTEKHPNWAISPVWEWRLQYKCVRLKQTPLETNPQRPGSVHFTPFTHLMTILMQRCDRLISPTDIAAVFVVVCVYIYFRALAQWHDCLAVQYENVFCPVSDMPIHYP